MDKFKKIVTEHRTAALICLFLLIVFIGGSAMSAVNVAHHRADIAAQQQQQAEEEQKTDEEKQQEKEEADPDLTDTQRKAIDNYDDDTKAFIETLSASVWSANNGTDTLQFTGHTYTETPSPDWRRAPTRRVWRSTPPCSRRTPAPMSSATPARQAPAR